MRNYFIFGTIDSRNYNVYISGTNVFNAPERAYEFIDVPGRNGAVIGPERRFNNIELGYPAFIYSSFQSKISDLCNALSAVKGYAKLTDSYHADEFRMATFINGIGVAPTRSLHAGKFDLYFSCKPQRYLNSGATVVTVANESTLNNPTKFDSLPRIEVVGYGDLEIGDQTITIDNIWPSIVIDSELGDCFSGTYNANGQVSFSTNDLPVLAPGNNLISFDNTITSVKITPRWWRL
jgi:phage-related protein